MKPHINTILKKCAELKPRKLDPNDPEIERLINETVKEQERVLKLMNVPDWVYKQRITI